MCLATCPELSAELPRSGPGKDSGVHRGEGRFASGVSGQIRQREMPGGRGLSVQRNASLILCKRSMLVVKSMFDCMVDATV